MNNKLKLGLSALCGSLAVSAANAGDLAVSGGADLSWSKVNHSTTGNPIGMGSNMTFTGTGELDNGWAFTLSIAHTNQAAYSSSNVNIDMGGMGSFKVTQGTGVGIDAYDDKMPTAWEETWGTAVGTGIDLVAGTQGNAVQYSLPAFAGISLAVAHAPRNGGAVSNDKGMGGDDGGAGATWDVTANINPSMLSGLNVFVGGSSSARDDAKSTTGSTGAVEGDHEEVTAGLTYAYGPVTLGFQKSGEFTGTRTAGNTDYYNNTLWGVSFNVSDDLSRSYNELVSEKNFHTDTSSVDTTITSYQIAYSIGGASLRYANADVDNASYTSGTASDKEGTTISLSLAF